MLSFGVWFILVAHATSGDAELVRLTTATLPAALVGKAAMVRFVQDDCPPCDDMTPAWDKLVAEYADSTDAIIGEVDCSAPAESEESLCRDLVTFPAIQYYTYDNGGSPHTYTGSRRFQELFVLAFRHLKPVCCSRRKDLCTDTERQTIEGLEALGPDQVALDLAERQAALTLARAEFGSAQEAMQNQAIAMHAAHEAGIKKLEQEVLLLNHVSFEAVC